MKKLLTILFLTISAFAFGQTKIKFNQINPTLPGNFALKNNGFSFNTDSLYSGVTLNKHTLSGTLVVMGTSIELATGINVGFQSGGTGWPTLVANATGLTLSNFSVSGSSVENRTPVNLPSGGNFISRESTIPTFAATTGPDKFLVISVGPNDFYANSANYNPTNYATDLTSLINYFHSTGGWPFANIYIVGNSYLDPAIYTSTYASFMAASATVAASLGVGYCDPYTVFANGGGTGLLSDQLHPNNQGHAVEANVVYQMIVPPTTFKAAQSLAAQSVQFSGLNVVGNSTLNSSTSTLVGRDALGNYGNANILPNNIKTGNTLYTKQLISSNITTSGLVTAGYSLGPNDWTIGDPTGVQYIYGTYPSLPGYGTRMSLMTSSAGYSFEVLQFSNGASPIVSFKSPLGVAALIQQNGQLNITDINTAYGKLYTQYGTIYPGDISGRTYINNTYSSGFISMGTTYGSGSTALEVMRLTKLGNVQIVPSATQTDAGFKFDNFGTARNQSGSLFGLLANPGTLSATPSTSGGSLTGSPYFAYLVAVDPFGNTSFRNVEGSVIVGAGSTGSIAYSWSAVTGATSYRVYIGTSSTAENVYIATSGTSITYTGSGTTGGTPPTANTTGMAQIASTGVSTFPSINIYGSASGLVSIKPQAAAGTYNFNLPSVAPTAGYYLTGQTGTTAYTWSAPPIHGNSTTTGTATTVVTVTIGTTMANNAYAVSITPRDLLTAVNYYISAQTTTTFDITFATALTGSINFDYTINP